MELANNTLTACFAMLRIIIIRVCVKSFVMARFLNPYLCAIWHKDRGLTLQQNFKCVKAKLI